MEFNEKLQELRKQKGLTQEELAEQLYVSRTAISKYRLIHYITFSREKKEGKKGKTAPAVAGAVSSLK